MVSLTSLLTFSGCTDTSGLLYGGEPATCSGVAQMNGRLTMCSLSDFARQCCATCQKKGGKKQKKGGKKQKKSKRPMTSPSTGMPILRKFTEFRKCNLVRMSSVNLDVFRKFPEFGQSQNWGIFLQKTHKNTPGNCKDRLPAYRRA